MIIQRRGKTSRGVQARRRTLFRMTGALAILMAATSSFEGQAAADSSPANLCEREMTRAAAKYDVPLAILYAIGLTETGRRGSLQPYALNIEGPSFFPETLDEAIRRVEAARKDGAKLIDIGCMQINHHFHANQFQSLAAMFEPRANVEYAARFLKALRIREGSWTLAAARYHAGPNNNPAQKRYVCKVIANLIASGFGAWTPGAHAFCH